MKTSDVRLLSAKEISLDVIADLLAIPSLVRAGRELTGPCPECGGRDRFSINTAKGVFQCRRCDAKGDGIELVRWMRKCTLPEALTWLCGDRPEISAEERAARRRKADARKAETEREEQARRRQAIAQARRIWSQGVSAEDSPVRGYLERRGFSRALLPDMPRCLRYHPDLPYMVQEGREWIEAHRGPAMLALVQQPDGSGTAVHRTWIDRAQPNGKALIQHKGEAQKVKKSWGSKKGAAIRLQTPAVPWRTLVMAEGIETTLTALVSGLFPDAAFWAGIDLGNIAGRMQQGKGLRYAGLPDLSDYEAFLPPPWTRQIVLIEDGDSEPRMTRAKLLSGARRAMARIPGLTARVVPCPEGLDLNDVLMEGHHVSN